MNASAPVTGNARHLLSTLQVVATAQLGKSRIVAAPTGKYDICSSVQKG